MASTKIRKIFGEKHMQDKRKAKRPHLLGIQVADGGFVRISQIVGDPKATPPIPALLPIGKSTWWKGVAEGRYPKGTKIGPRITVWDRSAVLKIANSHAPAASGR